MKSWCGTSRTPLLFLTRTPCFADPHRRSYPPTPDMLFWTHHWSGAREDCAVPQSQQLRGRRSCECFWAFPSSDHLLFFSSEWFSVFGVGLAHWTAIILWRWPLLSIFGLHPSPHYTDSKRKPQSTLEDRSRSKRQNCKVKRTSQSISRHVCLVQNQVALRKPGKPGEVSNVERGEKRLQNRKWSWTTEVWHHRGVYLFAQTCLCGMFPWYLCREINQTGMSWQKSKINKDGKLGAGPNQRAQPISSI